MNDTTKKEEGSRGQWSTNTGFILAAVGSAVGLGNIWRFPFATAENGGAVFILIYLAVLVLLGLPVMWAELSIGRRGRKNVVGSLQKLYTDATGGKSKAGMRFWTFAGMFFIFFCLFTISWYFVLGGWTLQYVFGSLSGATVADPDGFFQGVSEGPTTMIAHLVVVALTVGVVSFGVQKGIERVVFVVMPLLFLMITGVAVWGLFLDGTAEGYRFLLQPDFSRVTGDTIVAAVGQAFFSLSLGFGIMVTYASYLSKKESLAKNGPMIAGVDSVVALLAGFMLFPILASFALLTPAIEEGGGRSAIFLAMPRAFELLGGLGGQILTTVFFVLLFLAAYSSALAIFEVIVSYVSDHFDWGRTRITIAVGLLAYTAGILPALSLTMYDWLAGALTDLLVIVGGLLVVVFAGYIAKEVAEEMDENSSVRVSRFAVPLLRYFAPLALAGLLLVFLHGFLTDPAAIGASEAGALSVVVGVSIVVLVGFTIHFSLWLHRDANRRGENGRAWALLFAGAWALAFVLASASAAAAFLGQSAANGGSLWQILAGIGGVLAVGALVAGLVVQGVWRDKRGDVICDTQGQPLKGKKTAFRNYERVLALGEKPQV